MSWTPYDRDRPKKFIEKAIKLFKERDGRVIVEIGCNRMKLNHPIEENNHQCCCDGHSSVLLAQAGGVFYTCDINPDAIKITTEAIQHFPHVNIVLKDGVKFLRNFPMNIDLLFLDFIDVDLPGCAEKHLAAYKAVKRRLHEKTVVIIDDCDVSFVDGKLQPFVEEFGGKGRLLVPHMISEGWKVLEKGRCVILIKE